ncbi:hypothetical protein SAMN04489712_104440 [Thermomonospora echinospora]|uniref:Uncharacterized protein n=1 Tax=Thermomonospora echinospora TaxID=1992 RepID=A0A1H5Z9X9_9ACTN|nr:hypothetical protein [Thermomonospora echinospora]SEG33102.1 hypothetical protein SAMN04489712_104440 [Thermomonospora echinospora]
MSGPEETSESAVDSASPASDGTPSAPTPPSFGQAGAPVMESVPDPGPEQAASASEPEPEQAAPAFTVPLFGPDKPWWAATPDDDPHDDRDEPETGPKAAEPAVPEPPSATPPAAEPASTVEPGFLVAGADVPSVDTRGAVPAKPIKETFLPAYPDTTPDGIPLYPGPQDEPEGSAGPARPSTNKTPAPQTPQSPGQEASTPHSSQPEASAPHALAPEPSTSQAPEPKTPVPPAPERETPAPQSPEQKTSAPRSPGVEVIPQGEEPAGIGLQAKAGRPAAESVPSDDSGSEGALTPDAVLPPGVAPPEYTGPPDEGLPHTAPAASAEQLAEGGVILVVAQAPPESSQPFPETGTEQQRRTPDPDPQPMVRRRNQLMIAMVAIVILIPATVLAAFGLASSGGGDSSRAAERPTRSASPTARRTAPAAPPPTSRRPAPATIDSERTDSRPLALVEVFPAKEIELAERFFTQDRTSVNHQCGLAARGAMIGALERGNCRSVVRATYINRLETIAVTAGVAVMPTHRAALVANRAGDPAAYEWFRAMPGERSPDIDRAGGHAAGTVRGRYIVYAYAAYTDGTRPEPGDPTLKRIADEFIEYGLRPIDKRATTGT